MNEPMHNSNGDPAGGRRRRRGAGLRPGAAALERLEDRRLMATLFVNNTGDSGAGTLRQAILDANSVGGTSTIDFTITGSPGVQVIALAGPLPSITATVLIDGYSQAGSSMNSLAVGDNAVLQVELTEASNSSPFIPLTLDSGSTVRGLVIGGFPGQAAIDAFGSGNLIVGNFLGTDASGSTSLANGTGVLVGGPANTIGGADPSLRNVISGNSGIGIDLQGSMATANVVQGNYIGTDHTGAAALANGQQGVFVEQSASSNTIGGSVSGEGNVISGNGSQGVFLSGLAVSGNLVQGNYIGLDASASIAVPNVTNGVENGLADHTSIVGNIISGNSIGGVTFDGRGTDLSGLIQGNLIGTNGTGTAAVPNRNDGVDVLSGTVGLTIGGTAAAARNVISGNGGFGVFVTGSATSGNLIVGNYIGLNAPGTAALGNTISGVDLQGGTTGITIGGTSSASRNVISGNGSDGVLIDGISGATGSNVVLGNYLGTNASGSAAVGNVGNGVEIEQATSNTIGGMAVGSGNVISGNGVGVAISGASSTGNLVLGNLVGTDPTGKAKLANTNDGIDVGLNVGSLTIGGTAASARNVISGNAQNGITLNSGPGVAILGNYVGTDISGTIGLGNAAHGIRGASATNLTIGGTASGAGNVISGNGGDGIMLQGGGTNLVQGNLIGLGSDGASRVGNANDGIALVLSTTAGTIGGTSAAARNIISANVYGVSALDVQGAAIQGNYIGTDRAGAAFLGNTSGGLLFTDSANNTLGGTASGAGNLISANLGHGADFTGTGTTGNLIAGNQIGTDANGGSLGNSGDGILFQAGASSNIVGGTTSGVSNVIAFNALSGVVVQDSNSVGDAILSNSIFSNVSLGIDLGGDGPTANSPGGPHVGPNDLQNFPLVNIASVNQTGTTIIGTLDSTPNTTFLIQFFSDTGGPSGFSQGGTFYGQTTVTTNPSGRVTFSASVPPIAQGAALTATATSPTGDTSEFSQSTVVVNTNNSGFGSLRQAITDANLYPDIPPTISFQILTPGVQTIAPITPLPALTVPLLLDGYSQPGSSMNSLAVGENAAILVEISGRSIATSPAYGLDIEGPGVSIRGVAIDGFNGSGILAQNVGGFQVSGSYLGVGPSGTASVPGNSLDGITLIGTNGGTVGGLTPADRNVISGNTREGVLVLSGLSPATGALIANNYIGTDSSGTVPVANSAGGVAISLGNAITIGGATIPARNVISGNVGIGLQVAAGSVGTVIQGNFIGTDAFGSAAVANSVGAEVDAAGTTIGGASPEGFGTSPGNVIAGNSSLDLSVPGTTVSGLVIQGNIFSADVSGTTVLSPGTNSDSVFLGNSISAITTIGGTAAGAGNLVGHGLTLNGSGFLLQGNFIGTNAAGTGTLVGGQNVQDIHELATHVTIGGTAPGSGNLISGSATSGIYIGTGVGNGTNSDVLIQGNKIGTDVSGTAAIPNFDGIYAQTNLGVTIGGTSAAARNIISGNADGGVALGDIDDVVLGNYIGTDTTGSTALPNGAGLFMFGSESGLILGGTTAGAGNVISGNSSYNALLTRGGNLVQGNIFGLDATGMNVVANGGPGLRLFDSGGGQPGGDTVGGTTASARNLVSGNTGSGIEVNGSNAVILGNYVGLNLAGQAAGNTGAGIAILGGTSNTIGGTASGSANVISANDGDGVALSAAADNNVISGDLIGTDPSGTSALGNSGSGVTIADSSFNIVGGLTAAERNIISGNGDGGSTHGNGVQITGSNAVGNAVLGDYIGTDSTGGVALGNSLAGVVLASGATNSTIGFNVISGNAADGVVVQDSTSTTNFILGNEIGTNSTGTASLGNGGSGILLDGAAQVTVGGTVSGSANVISGNSANGITLAMVNATSAPGADLIAGNLIGTDASGTQPLGNFGNGILLADGAFNVTIGGTSAGARNIISGNLTNGIGLQGVGTSNNLIVGNYVGTDLTGSSALGNGDPTNQSGTGIIDGAGPGNTIGGTIAGAGNVISGNVLDGIDLLGASGELIVGNRIGTDATGTFALSTSGASGIILTDLGSPGTGSNNNTIGGASPGFGNLISGNGPSDFGIDIDGTESTGNLILGNTIGANAAVTAALGNGNGVGLTNGAAGNTVGGTASGSANILSGNINSNVLLDASGPNLVVGNLIGSNATGTAPWIRPSRPPPASSSTMARRA